MVATTPPMRVAIDHHADLDVLLGRPTERLANRSICESSSGTARAHLGNLVLAALRRELDEPRHDRREDRDHDPRPTMNAAIARVVCSERFSSSSSTIGGTAVGRLPGVRERLAQIVVAFDDPGEAEQLVLDLVQIALALRDLEQRLRPGFDAVGHG